MSYSDKVSSIIKEFGNRGLNKWAGELSEVKESMLFNVHEYSPRSKWVPLSQRGLLGDKNRPESTPSDPAIKPYNDGDFVIGLNPVTMKEEPMMFDAKRNKLVPMDEVGKMIDKGIMREERVFEQYEKAPPELKAQMDPLINGIQKKKPFLNMSPGEVGVPYSPMQKMARISDCIEKRGYPILVKKLKTAMEDYKKLISDNS